MANKSIPELEKFIKNKLSEGYNSKEIEQFLIRQNFDKNLINKLLKPGIKNNTKKTIFFKILFLVVIPLLITSACVLFLKNGQVQSSFETEQKISRTTDEECFRVTSELMEEYFDSPTIPTYREFLSNSLISVSYRDFFNRRSKTSQPMAFWRHYTFGTQTSLSVSDVPSPVKNYLFHLDYDLNQTFVGCVAVQLTPKGKYGFMDLNAEDIKKFENLDYEFQPVKTDFGEFDLRFYKRLYLDNKDEEMFSSFIITFLHQSAKGFYEESKLTSDFQKFLLKQKLRRWIPFVLLFFTLVVAMFFLSRFYFKFFLR